LPVDALLAQYSDPKLSDAKMIRTFDLMYVQKAMDFYNEEVCTVAFLS
jgi:hypothetical protein